MTPETKALVERVVKHLNDYDDDPGFSTTVAMNDLADYLVENGLAVCTSSSGFSVRVPNTTMDNPHARCNGCYEYRNYHVNHCTCEF